MTVTLNNFGSSHGAGEAEVQRMLKKIVKLKKGLKSKEVSLSKLENGALKNNESYENPDSSYLIQTAKQKHFKVIIPK